MESGNTIDAQALAWLVKRDSECWTESDQDELVAWLGASTAHRIAFLRREAAWERSERLKVFSVRRKAGAAPPPPGALQASPFFADRRSVSRVSAAIKKSRSRVAAIAAIFLLAAGVGLVYSNRSNWNTYSTPIGSFASIPLQDGSTMTLNTATSVRVALTEKERRIELESGEAFFDVAKDPGRPFVVEAGNRRIVAVGTQFSVRRNGLDVQVIVTDGKVRFEPKAGDGRAELLSAGAIGDTVRDSLLVQKKSLHETEAALSWRNGYLTFDETTLVDAVAEFNRYTSQQIVIDDPELTVLRVTGTFRASRAGDFVELLNKSFGIQIRESGDAVHLNASELRK